MSENQLRVKARKRRTGDAPAHAGLGHVVLTVELIAQDDKYLCSLMGALQTEVKNYKDQNCADMLRKVVDGVREHCVVMSQNVKLSLSEAQKELEAYERWRG